MVTMGTAPIKVLDYYPPQKKNCYYYYDYYYYYYRHHHHHHHHHYYYCYYYSDCMSLNTLPLAYNNRSATYGSFLSERVRQTRVGEDQY